MMPVQICDSVINKAHTLIFPPGFRRYWDDIRDAQNIDVTLLSE